MNAIPNRKRCPLATAVAAYFALLALAPCAYAAYDNVLNCNDTGAGSLRDTVTNAQPGDTVILNPVTMQCSTISVVSGEIVIPQNDLTIKYNGNNTNRFVLSGNHRVFNHKGTGKLTLQRLTMQLGKATDADAVAVSTGKYSTANTVAGGCVYSAGVVDLENSEVKYCSVTSSFPSTGGGISAHHGLIMNHSTLRNNSVTAVSPAPGSYAHCGGALVGYLSPFSDGRYINANYSTVSNNAAGGLGGGLCISGQGYLNGDQSTIQNSTISGNSAASHSAIADACTPLTIANSTISGNSATKTTYSPGAIYTGCDLTLRNSTVTFNSAANGPAIWFHTNGVAVEFESSIVAKNTSNAVEADIYNYTKTQPILTITGANNIVMRASASIVLPKDTRASDPLLLPLANNGGPTLTHAFRDGSPAFGNGANSLNLSTDQRGTGFARTVNGATDIGAFQQQVRDVIFANGFD